MALVPKGTFTVEIASIEGDLGSAHSLLPTIGALSWRPTSWSCRPWPFVSMGARSLAVMHSLFGATLVFALLLDQLKVLWFRHMLAG